MGVRTVEVMGMYPLGMLGMDGVLMHVPKGVEGPLDTGETGMALARMERARCFAVFSSSNSPRPLPTPV